jgi:peroxiredoxin
MQLRRDFAFGMLLAAVLLTGATHTTQGQPEKEEQADDSNASIRTSLQAKLDSMRLNFVNTAPSELVVTFERGVEQVRETGVLDEALAVGDTAVDFSLPSAVGDSISLAELRKQGPVVLIWYRGGWCPYCNTQLRAMREILPELRSHNATMVAISPETPDNSMTTVEKSELDFEVLSVVGNRVAHQYGIVYKLPDEVASAFEGRIDLEAYNGDDSKELPLAVTYVVGRDGVIRYAFLDADYRKRAEPSRILEVLTEL